MTGRRFPSRGVKADTELDKEMRFHLERLAADLIARGVPPEEARRQAHIEFGGAEQVKEECRDVRPARWLGDLLVDIRYALRSFRQLPGFALLAVMILGLGIGATTVMFTMVDGVLLRPLAYPDADRLIAVHGFAGSIGEYWGFSYPDFVDVRREARSLSAAAWTYSGGIVSAPGDPEYVDARAISADLLGVLGVRLTHGRSFTPQEDAAGGRPVAIVSNGMWQRRYGGAGDIVGQRLVFDGTPLTIVGVAPAGFALDGDADVFTPLGQRSDPRMQSREARFIHIVGRLGPRATMSGAQAELTVIGRRLAGQYPASNAGHELRATSLQSEIVGDIGSTLWLLLGAVGFVLLIACVNIANLLLARAVSRQRELATRVALGASRGRVIRQCLTESAVLGIAGGAIGVLIAAVSVGPFVALWPGSLPRAADVHLDWRVMGAALVVSVASGIAFGLAPAFRVPFANVEAALRAGGRSLTPASRRLHSGLVIAELGCAVVLLASAGMLARTLLRLSTVDPGIDVRGVVTGRFALAPDALADTDRIQAVWQQVLDRARSVPGVATVALTDTVPMRTGSNSVPYSTAGAPIDKDAPLALASTVTPDYLNVMGIRLLDGRFFDDHDRLDAEPVLVVDEDLALHAFGRRDVVGQRLWVSGLGQAPLRIVGVVAHVRHWGLAADDVSRVRDQIYYPFAQVPTRMLRTFSSFMTIAVRTTIPPLDVVAPLRQRLRGEGADQALYDVHTMEQLVGASLARQRFLALLFGIFGGVALVLASVGVYGVFAYLTRQREAEFGLRMALGATPRDIMRLVVRESAALIGAGLLLGTAGAWIAGRVLERSVEGMLAPDAGTYAVMVAVLISAAFAASLVPARRAARILPMHALRND